jgi:hypothetical protein
MRQRSKYCSQNGNVRHGGESHVCVVSRYMYVLLSRDLIASDVWGVTARHGNVLGRCLGACPY